MTERISKELIRAGLDNGIIRLVDNDGEIVCVIGEYWFMHLDLPERKKM